MTESHSFPKCSGIETEALEELLAEHGRDLYRFVTVNELGEMIEDRVMRILRARPPLDRAA